jgi:hypothetical protein
MKKRKPKSSLLELTNKAKGPIFFANFWKGGEYV